MADNRTLQNGAVTATGAGAGFTVPPGNTVSVQIVVSAVSGTSPSATFKVQWSEDGATWCDVEPAEDFTAITAVKSTAKSFIPKGPNMRLAWTVSGTTPSFTTKATVYGLNDD